MSTNMPKNVYQIQKFYRAIAVANAVQAAAGNVMDFEDALQSGLLLAMEAYKSADPRKGDIWQYITLRMTAARQEARELAMEPVESETDLARGREEKDGEDDESLMESFQGLEDEEEPLEELELWQLALRERLERMTVPVVPDTDGSADEKSPTYVHLVPAPEKQPGAAFAIYGMDPMYVQPDGLHGERLTSMQDDDGNWPDSTTRWPGEIEVVDEDGLVIEDEPLAEGEEPDMGYEHYSAIPTEEEVEAGLAEHFEILATFPCKYSPASREAFCRAMLHGAGMKAAQSAAWSVHRGLAVKAVRQGLVLPSGKIVAWHKATHTRLSQPDYAVCSKLVTNMPGNAAAMAWVDARVAL